MISNRLSSLLFVAFVAVAASACHRQPTNEQKRQKAIDLMNQAERLQSEGKYFEARDCYHKSIDWFPLPLAYFNLGNCYLAMGQYQRAEYYFRQASAANPNESFYASQAQYAAELAGGGKPDSTPATSQPARLKPDTAPAVTSATAVGPAPAATPKTPAKTAAKASPKPAAGSAAKPATIPASGATATTSAAASTPPIPSAIELREALFPPTADRGQPGSDAVRSGVKREKGESVLDSARFHLDTAESLERRGLLPEALAEYYEAALAKPDDLDIRLRALALLIKMGREEKAGQLLETLRQKFPDSPEVFYQSGNFHLRRNENEAAIADYEKAIALAPDFVKACNNIGVARMNSKQYKEAVAAFEKTLATDPDNPSAHLNLGLVFDQHLSDPARARYHYQRYLALGGPRAEEVKQWLADLSGRHPGAPPVDN